MRFPLLTDRDTHDAPDWSDTLALDAVKVEQSRDDDDDDEDEVSYSPQSSVPREQAMPTFPSLDIFLTSTEMDEIKPQESVLPPGDLNWDLSAILALLALLVVVPGFLGFEVEPCTVYNAMNLVIMICLSMVAVTITTRGTDSSKVHNCGLLPTPARMDRGQQRTLLVHHPRWVSSETQATDDFNTKPEECEGMHVEDSTNLRLCYILEQARRLCDDEERNVPTALGADHVKRYGGEYASRVLDRGNDLCDELEPTNLHEEVIAGGIESESTEYFIDPMVIAILLTSQLVDEIASRDDELMGDGNGLYGTKDSSSTGENEPKRGSETSDDGSTELFVPELPSDEEDASTISSGPFEYSLERQDEEYQHLIAQGRSQQQLSKRHVSDAHSVCSEASWMASHEGNDDICDDFCTLGDTHASSNMHIVDFDETLIKIWNARSPGVEYGPDEASV